MAGGFWVGNGAVGCSWGFSVREKANPGVQGFLTAGHCVVGARDAGYTGWLSYNNLYLGETIAGSYPGNDFGWVVKSDESDVTFNGGVLINSSGGIRDINSSGATQVGETACSYGATNEYDCGFVGAKNQTVNYGEGNVYGMDALSGMCRGHGDSGGPLFIGNKAVGLFSGFNATTCVTHWQPVTEVLNLYGLEVY